MDIKHFSELKLPKQILNALDEKGYYQPTPIQMKAIPSILAGHDLIGIAPSGTGKTAAYLLPLLQKLNYATDMHPRALILVPTRELVVQVINELENLGKYKDLRYAGLYGGTGITIQMESIKSGQDIIVATPGRLLDIYSRQGISLRSIQMMILDEADKMMDMGFMPQINRILEIIPSKKRQNLLFSATFPEKVGKLSMDFLDFPDKIEIRPQSTVAENVKQYFYRVPNLKSKINLLAFLLQDKKVFKRVIIFTKTKKTANDVYKYILRKIDDKAQVIHANKSQNSRLNAINAFKEGDLMILVSTDVTARGIDISMVSHVINFDVPLVYEDYVHRIGRTGRMNQKGVSLTFVNKPDACHLDNIEKIIREKIPEKNIPKGVVILPTEAWEEKTMAMEMDRIKSKNDPDHKPGFHKKKRKHAVKGLKKTKFKRK